MNQSFFICFRVDSFRTKEKCYFTELTEWKDKQKILRKNNCNEFRGKYSIRPICK